MFWQNEPSFITETLTFTLYQQQLFSMKPLTRFPRMSEELQ